MNEKNVFIGVSLCDRSQKRLSRAMEGWETLPMFISRPEFLHVNIFSFGFILPEDLPRIAEGAREICVSIDAFDMPFEEIHLSPDPLAPKAILLSGEESPSLLLLRNAFEKCFAEKKAENKQFRPRVSLARIRKEKWNALPEGEKPNFPQSISIVESVSSITLFESTREGGGRQYIPIEEYPLG